MKPPFLNGSSAPVRLRVPSGKIRNEFPSRRRLCSAIDRRQALIRVAAFERYESSEIERLRQDRQAAQLGLVEDPQPGKQIAQRREDDRRLDVARVIHRVDGGALALDMFVAVDAHRDAAEEHPEPHAPLADAKEHRRIPDQDRQEHERRADQQDVEGDGGVGRDRAQRRNE